MKIRVVYGLAQNGKVEKLKNFCNNVKRHRNNKKFFLLYNLKQKSSLQSKIRSSIQSAKTRLGADCGSDHELLIAKFRLKLKKVGKTTRPFRYDLNQIPDDYTGEV